MDHPYADFLLQVEKPIRYLGGEYGSAPRAEGGTTVALAFPDTYEIGMCFLGFHILYDILRREPEVQVERAFAPWPDLERELRARRVPLVSLESARPLRDFDIVGFSLQYELSFTNVLAMLDLGGIPLRSGGRAEADPLVIAGGPIAFQPEPMAPFIDAFVLGDGEEVLPAIVRAVRRLRSAGAPRREILEHLAGIPGIYVPALVPVREDPSSGLLVAEVGVNIARTPAVDLAAHPFPTTLPVPDTEVVFDRYSIEISRGCNGGCRFCQGGFVYRPLRLRGAPDVLEAARRGLRSSGFDGISLTSLSTADYPGIEGLVGRLAAEFEPEGITVSVSSLRAYDIPDELLAGLGALRRATLTFALEAGTQRLRNLVNKNVREEDILRTAERIFSLGWQRMKLYFMIGLPSETDDDVRSIIDVTRSIYAIARRYGPRAARGITASVSTFVPKPHTPFQWEGMIPESEIRRRHDLLFDLARTHRLSLKWHDAAMSIVEGVMARADRRVAEAVLRAYELGCRFDGWADRIDFDAWRRAFSETGIDMPRYLGSLPAGGRLPWDHLSAGIQPAFLLRESEKAGRGEETAPCGFGGVCHGCGAACEGDTPAAAPAELPPPPAPRARAGEPLPFRVAFRRSGRLSYVSQLDLVRIFPRLFRRAGLLMSHTQGMRPRPIFSFSPALPLGATVLRDLLDVKLDEGDLNGGELVERLSAVAPGGLQILAARQLRGWEKKLSRRVDAVDNAVPLGGRVDPDAVEAATDRFLDAESVQTVISTKKEPEKRIDLRSWVYEARVTGEIGGIEPAAGPFLFFRIKSDARPLAIAEHLLGRPVPGTWLYRVDLVARGPLGFAAIQ